MLIRERLDEEDKAGLEKHRIDFCQKNKEKIDILLFQVQQRFQEGLSVMNTLKARLHLKQGCTPKFCKARSVLFTLRPAVETEISRLEKEGVLKPVMHSQWALPVVPAPKNNGHLRLCSDCKITLNPAMEVDKYPLPKPENLFASLARGRSSAR